jgi:fatty acid CoA ligase FadD9
MDERQEQLARLAVELIGSDAQVRAAVPDPAVGTAVADPSLRTAQIVATIMRGYADRPALGQRSVEFVADSAGRRHGRLLPGYDTITYAELWERVTALLAAWQHGAEYQVGAKDFVAVLGFTSLDYTIIDVASTIWVDVSSSR